MLRKVLRTRDKATNQFILFRTDFEVFVLAGCTPYSNRYMEIVCCMLQSFKVGPFFSFLTPRVSSTLFFALNPVRFSGVTALQLQLPLLSRRTLAREQILDRVCQLNELDQFGIMRGHPVVLVNMV